MSAKFSHVVSIPPLQKEGFQRETDQYDLPKVKLVSLFILSVCIESPFQLQNLSQVVIYSSEMKSDLSKKIPWKVMLGKFFLLKKQKSKELRKVFSFRAMPWNKQVALHDLKED